MLCPQGPFLHEGRGFVPPGDHWHGHVLRSQLCPRGQGAAADVFYLARDEALQHCWRHVRFLLCLRVLGPGKLDTRELHRLRPVHDHRRAGHVASVVQDSHPSVDVAPHIHGGVWHSDVLHGRFSQQLKVRRGQGGQLDGSGVGALEGGMCWLRVLRCGKILEGQRLDALHCPGVLHLAVEGAVLLAQRRHLAAPPLPAGAHPARRLFPRLEAARRRHFAPHAWRHSHELLGRQGLRLGRQGGVRRRRNHLPNLAGELLDGLGHH
mmetsp:Transcript_61829/g.188810  ORF Transcript_61829/g.188810 Transcript_61829/m.188810 type:complete len:265 (-) Transcript_61829:527-1321(-)